MRVIYLTSQAKLKRISEPPKTSALRSESQISCGTFEVREERAAPMPSVIKTAGNVQQIKVDRLVSKASVGAAVSRIARRALLTYDFSGAV